MMNLLRNLPRNALLHDPPWCAPYLVQILDIQSSDYPHDTDTEHHGEVIDFVTQIHVGMNSITLRLLNRLNNFDVDITGLLNVRHSRPKMTLTGLNLKSRKALFALC